MKASTVFLYILFIIVHLAQVITHPLLNQIAITRKLISLYQQKLQILLDQAKEQNITQIQNIRNKQEKLMWKIEQQLLFEIHNFIGKNAIYMPPGFILTQGYIKKLDNLDVKGTKYSGQLIGLGKYSSRRALIQADILIKFFTIFQAYLLFPYKRGELWVKIGLDFTSQNQYLIAYCLNQSSNNNIINKTLLITTYRISQNRIKIVSLREGISQKQLPIQIKNQVGKWHHASKFQSLFLQSSSHSLIISNQYQTQTYKFKSQLISYFSIHQYKLIFVTRLSYGFMNPKTFQIPTQINFQSIAETAYYSNQQKLLLILFKNGTLSVIEHEKILNNQQIERRDRWGNRQVSMQYVGRNYLFIYGNGPCFDVYEICAPGYSLLHFKQFCIPNDKNTSQVYQNYKYQFFKHQNIYKLILTDIQSNSKIFHLLLPQRQLKNQKSLPWKPILILFGVLVIIYWKSKKSKSDKPQFNQSIKNQTKKPNKNIIRQKQQQKNADNFKQNSINRSTNSGSDYIRQLDNQIKKKKIYFDPKKFD